MRKSGFIALTSAACLLLAACGGPKENANSSSVPASVVESSLEQSSVAISSSSLTSSSLSSEQSSKEEQSSIQDVQIDSWVEWTEENKTKVNDFLNAASKKEPNVISNTIKNGVVAEGVSSYSEYSFKKGKRSNGETACYHKTPTQTSYYYYDEKIVGGYVEKVVDGEKKIVKAASVNESRFNGYDLSTMMVKSGNGFCGGYASLAKMVENGISNGNKDTEFKFRTNGFDMKYAIYSKVTYTYWNTVISASFASDGTLTTLNYKYAESYAKNVDKNDDGTFAFKEDAQLDYKETIYQAEVGELTTLDMPVDPSSFNYTSFDVYSGTTKIEEGSTINTDLVDGGVILDVLSVSPSTASPDFDEWTISVKKAGTKANTEDNFFDPETSTIHLGYIKAQGTFDVVIKTKNVSLSFTVVVGKPIAEAIAFYGLRQEPGGMSVIDIKSSITTGETTIVCPLITPTAAEQNATLTINAPEGVSESDYSLLQKTYKSTDITFVYYEFSSTKAGAYTFVATIADNPSITASYTMNVTAPLSADEIFDGKYCYYIDSLKMMMFTLEFTPNKSTSKQGDGEVKITTVKTGKYGIYTYTAASSGKTINLTYKTGVDGTVQDLFEASITSDGTRGGVSLKYMDDPVGWPGTVALLDWADYESKYLA